jgi:methylated-DNA-[protein]-cysteine S-methyltransferase
MKSPVGKLKLVGDDQGLMAILWENERLDRVSTGPLAEAPDHPVLREAERQINEYFAGKRKTFSLAFDLAGTKFQKAVWQALRTIPFGETRTYSEIARRVGRSRAVRAVGAANGRNPIPIVVPCHRVIGANGTLTGFAGGLETKAILLRLESGTQLWK